MISKITAIIMSIVALISNFSGLLPSELIRYNDVSYGTHSRQVMDVCFPEDPEKNEGIVLFIHGGAWKSGDKSTFNKKIEKICKNVGCITASMNYRYISSDVHCTDQLNDITSAIGKIKSMAETRGINCEKIMIVGFSAGAHLSLLYSYAQKSKSPVEICAVVSYSGPPDLRSHNFRYGFSGLDETQVTTLMSNLTGEDLSKLSKTKQDTVLYKYSPLRYVTKNCVPTLIVHGVKDDIVDINDVRYFVNQLTKKGVELDYYELPDSGHSLSEDSYIFAQSEKTFVDFVNLYIK